MKLALRTKLAKKLGIQTKAFKRAERRQAFMVLNQRDALAFYPELKGVYEVQASALKFYQTQLNGSESSMETYKRNVDRAMIDGLEAIHQLDKKREVTAFNTDKKQEVMASIKAHEMQSLRQKAQMDFNEKAMSDKSLQSNFNEKYATWSHAYFNSPEFAVQTYPELKGVFELERSLEREFSYTLEKKYIQSAVTHYINESLLALAKGMPMHCAEEIARDAMLLQYSSLGREDLISRKANIIKSPDEIINDLGGVAKGEWLNVNEMDKGTLADSIKQSKDTVKLNQMRAAFLSYPKEQALSLHSELEVIYKKYEAALTFYEQKVGKEHALNAAQELLMDDFELALNQAPLLAVTEVDEKHHIDVLEKVRGNDIEHAPPKEETLTTAQTMETQSLDTTQNIAPSYELTDDDVMVNHAPINIEALVQTLSLSSSDMSSALDEYLAINHISVADKGKIEQALVNKGMLTKQNPAEAISMTPSLVVNNDVPTVNLSALHSTAPKLELLSIFNTTVESKTIKKDTKFVMHDKDALIAALNQNAEAFAVHLLGEPLARQGDQLRFGTNKGSLIVTVKGEKAGLWCDHQTNEGGGLLKLIMVEKNLNFPDALSFASDYTGMEPTVKQSQRIDVSDLNERGLDDSKLNKVRYARQLANESLPLEGTLAETYLKEHRGIDTTLCSKEIRFLESIKEPSSQKHYPALLVIGKNSEGVVEGVQVTYLNSDANKAKGIESAKRSYGVIKGSSIPVHEGGNMIAVAEGVETALSVASANPNLTVFSSLGSISNFSAQDFNAKGQTILICADNDPINNPASHKINRAADELANKGFNVFIAKPKEVGKDFNDVLKEKGVDVVKTLINTPAIHRMKQTSMNKNLDRGPSFEKKRDRSQDQGMSL